MVRYWDASAIMPLLVWEDSSNRMRELILTDSAVLTWWGTSVECASGLARMERDQQLGPEEARAAFERLRQSAGSWLEVPASVSVRDHAIRLLRVHRLRAGDALQLAAGVVAADFDTSALEFVTVDTRQAAAAEREGFRVLS